MNESQEKQPVKKSLLTWMTAFGLAAAFLLWGLFVYRIVGVKWPPVWEFGVIADVPGSSVYSTHPQQPGRPGFSASLHEEERLVPQHVQGSQLKKLGKEKTE